MTYRYIFLCLLIAVLGACKAKKAAQGSATDKENIISIEAKEKKDSVYTPLKPLIFSEMQHGKTVQLQVTQKFSVRLPSNTGSTGYTWSISYLDGDICEHLGNNFEGTPTMIGAPIQQVWHFKALQTGSTDLIMQYTPAHNPPDAPADVRMYQLHIVVE
jgi:predicted secreted protein